MRHVTIKDLARHLSLSISTVSRGLADDAHIKASTKARIMAAASELGYRRNPFAASLRAGRSNVIGVIVPEMLTPFAAGVIRGVQEIAHPLGIHVLTVDSNNDPLTEARNLLQLERSRVDGIVAGVSHWERNGEAFQRVMENGIPIVYFGYSPRDISSWQVVADDYANALELLQHLVDIGRRRIVHLCGPGSVLNFVDQRRAYREAHRRNNLHYDEHLIVPVLPSVESGRNVADRLITYGKEFDAIFACTDIVAIGVMNRLRELGKRVPEDVAVAGFYGSPLSSIVHPALTTVEPQLAEMGIEAARLLLHAIDHPDDEPCKVTVDAKVCLRASSLC